MFGVVVCPRCHRAKGVDLSKKTTTCSCGFAIRIVPARIRLRVGTERELIEAVRRVSADLAGGLSEYERAVQPRRKTRIAEVHARAVEGAGGVLIPRPAGGPRRPRNPGHRRVPRRPPPGQRGVRAPPRLLPHDHSGPLAGRSAFPGHLRSSRRRSFGNVSGSTSR